MMRFVGRCGILLFALFCVFFSPDVFAPLYGGFFESFTLLHLLWGVWVFDMVCQLFPIKKEISLGSMKIFRARFRPIREKINREALRGYISTVSKSAYGVMLLWIALLAVLGTLYYAGIINEIILLMVSIAFYVCDLICVLFWCPFRLMMKTRCCTTCRIFNWDHFMMLSPMMFINSFFARSLFIGSVIIFVAWELCILLHPERFWEHTNIALTCAECTDKLCTQYCQKLRKRQK